MRTFTVPKRGYGRSKTCEQCRRTLKMGDCAFVQKFTYSSFGGQNAKEFFYHRACIEALLEEAPLDAKNYMKEFEALREQAEATGTVF